MTEIWYAVRYRALGPNQPTVYLGHFDSQDMSLGACWLTQREDEAVERALQHFTHASPLYTTAEVVEFAMAKDDGISTMLLQRVIEPKECAAPANPAAVPTASAPSRPPPAGVLQQAPPTAASGDCWLDVMADMEARRQFGIDKYRQPVQALNGRNSVIDFYQELLDGAVYARQLQHELQALAQELTAIQKIDTDSDAEDDSHLIVRMRQRLAELPQRYSFLRPSDVPAAD